jgi:predicted nucleic acid-binding protein
MADAQIAATCIAHGAILATRNLSHFEGLGLAMIDPWTVGAR